MMQGHKVQLIWGPGSVFIFIFLSSQFLPNNLKIEEKKILVYESRELGNKPWGKIKYFCMSSLSRDCTYQAPTLTYQTPETSSAAPQRHAPLHLLRPRHRLLIWTVPSVSQSLCPHHY